ncbi:unnamed protein product [Cuscuta epithymum]|uniref:Uncharacterized protein n=1 Tax=Cuscuta epithymum TaxID=186058 RepID=A0AAV0DSB5_9ASTE|nr:unnamed protein product [Cuscuta epithymum]
MATEKAATLSKMAAGIILLLLAVLCTGTIGEAAISGSQELTTVATTTVKTPPATAASTGGGGDEGRSVLSRRWLQEQGSGRCTFRCMITCQCLSCDCPETPIAP